MTYLLAVLVILLIVKVILLYEIHHSQGRMIAAQEEVIRLQRESMQAKRVK